MTKITKPARNFVSSIFGAIFLIIFSLVPLRAAVISVDTTADVLDAAVDCNSVTLLSLPGPDGVTTLREAICATNNEVGPDEITFAIPGTFLVQSELPALTDDNTTINAIGSIVILDGSQAGNASGLNISSSFNVVSGLRIRNFQNDGISMISTANDNQLINNRIIGNNNGVWISGGSRNRITGNRIRLNDSGISMSSGSQDNIVGTDGDGNNDANEGNIIQSNDDRGVNISSADNAIAGNNIVDNGTIGVSLTGNNNIVGTNGDGISDTLERNIIEGNGTDGVTISLSINNVVAGNLIINNGEYGVYLHHGGNTNVIGTNGDGLGDASEKNIISGNAVHGIFAQLEANDNVIAGNWIGTDRTGANPLPNQFHGIELSATTSGNRVGTDANGQSDVEERNIISGNLGEGILVAGEQQTVSGNYIGIDASGLNPLGNGLRGVVVAGGAMTNQILIGGLLAVQRNVISANGGFGIFADAKSCDIGCNYIGVDASGSGNLGNAGSGIEINGIAINNQYQLRKNLISNNPTGIYLFAGTPNVVARRNHITGNTVGVRNGVPGTLDAIRNWWGDVSGPSNGASQCFPAAAGIGDSVECNNGGMINYNNWLQVVGPGGPNCN